MSECEFQSDEKITFFQYSSHKLECHENSRVKTTIRNKNKAVARRKEKIQKKDLDRVFLYAFLALELALVAAKFLGEATADVADASVEFVWLALADFLHF